MEKQTITKEIVKKDRCEEEAPDVFESFSSESGKKNDEWDDWITHTYR